jgi:hypothetical protein
VRSLVVIASLLILSATAGEEHRLTKLAYVIGPGGDAIARVERGQRERHRAQRVVLRDVVDERRDEGFGVNEGTHEGNPDGLSTDDFLSRHDSSNRLHCRYY